ncbi:MAG: DUF92 domain-containing protein [Ignavibacteria bacterium]
MNEFKSILILTSITFAFIVLFEYLARKNIISSVLSRKLLHVITGFIVVSVPFLIENFYLVMSIGIAFSVSNLVLIKKNLLKQIDTSTGENLGIFYYPLSFLICVFLFWNVNKYLLSLSFLIFSFSDAMAAIVGLSAKSKYQTKITNEPKTFNGLIAFVLSSFLLMWILRITVWNEFNFIQYDYLSFAFIAFIFSLVGGITEILSIKGSDNLFLPVILSTTGMVFFVAGIKISEFGLAFVLAFLISVFSYKMKFLDFGGSAVTFFLALFILGIGGWKWTIPILTFFILSSLLSKFADKVNGETTQQIFEKGSKRDYKQVLANGGVPLLVCILSVIIPLNIDWYLIYLLAVSISTADTWSTEFGTLFAKNVYMISSFKKVEAGISGGISVIGTIGGIVGSIVIVLSGLLFVQLTMNQVFWIVLFALGGNFVDSLLGASLQVTYKCSNCGKLTEKKTHCNLETNYFKGIKFIDNDVVNFASVLFISIVYFIFLIV